jgi:diguanylate cyclase (GGDEF)-like protein
MSIDLPRRGVRKLSLRIRLTLVIATLCSVVVVATTVVFDLFELKQQQARLDTEAANFHGLVQDDLIEVALAGSPDKAAEFVLKMERFPRLQGLWLYDSEGRARFQYAGAGVAAPDSPGQVPASSLWQGDYWHVFALQLSGENLGAAIYRTRSTSLPQRLKANLVTDIIFIPFLLLLAWWLANRAASRYVRPIHKLLTAVDNPASETGGLRLETADDILEAERLFIGFNRLEERIQSTREALEAELADKAYQATHDTLTGLLNRQGFENAAQSLLTSDSREKNCFGYLDLDQFKAINDTVGHPAGDVYLRQLAGLLQDWCPAGSTVARLGGDEFGLILPGISRELASELAQQLLDRIRDARFVWDGKPFEVGASIGFVTFTAGESTLAWLYQAADTACYAAKAAGRGRFVWYHTDDVSVLEQQNDIDVLNRIRGAVAKGPDRFELWAQTIEPLGEALRDGQLRYEVLLRMRDANGRMVSPGEFLPAAERRGEIVRIDCWVLWNYLQTVSEQPAHLEKLAFADVNVTGLSLIHPDFRGTLERAIATFPFPWEKLTLEITETSAVRNFEQARHFIEYCKSHGIRFALDDFGTGMASFDYLKRLPFDTIKIDGSFVLSVLEDPMDEAVIEFIVRAASLKGQHTVAEFVENEEILRRLLALGVQFGQGYHLGRPRPLQDWLAGS